VHERLSVLALFFGSIAFDGHAAIPFVVFKNADLSHSDGLHAGDGVERVREVAIEGFDLLGFVAQQCRVDIEADQALDRKAWSEIAQVLQSTQEESCSDQE